MLVYGGRRGSGERGDLGSNAVPILLVDPLKEARPEDCGPRLIEEPTVGVIDECVSTVRQPPDDELGLGLDEAPISGFASFEGADGVALFGDVAAADSE